VLQKQKDKYIRDTRALRDKADLDLKLLGKEHAEYIEQTKIESEAQINMYKTSWNKA
jgi:hypothetical protein